jgi:hypothetical protein
MLLLMTALALPVLAAEDVPLKNPSFDEGLTDKGVPVGWNQYGGGQPGQALSLVGGATGKGLLINDGSATGEIGVTQTVPVRAGVAYRVSVQVARHGTASTAGAYLQFRCQPGDKYVQVSLAAPERGFGEVAATMTAPAGAERATIYLYCHRDPTPQVIVDDVRLQSGVEVPTVAAQAAGPPIPEPVVPQYDRLKDLHLTTWLVKEGQPHIAIVAPPPYERPGRAIQAAIAKATGVTVPLVHEAPVPLAGNLVLLGNRSTNAAIGKLYDRGYTFLDLKYPGPGGHVVRTLHSPFGDGRNVIFVGGSDDAGVAAGAAVLIGTLKAGGTPAPRGNLSVGYLADIKLSAQYQTSDDVKKMEIWEASKMYGSSGYFGWNMISKHMANYYMTGDTKSLQEFLRLSFPDAAAIKEIEAYDGERIENKNDPLAGPYHYAAHMMILLWDLIEESPDLTDEQRLKITNAFARQLPHRVVEGVYRATGPAGSVGNRHGDWAAFALYALGRYFDKDYSSPVWQRCLDAGDQYFAALKRTYWMAGYNDHLFWFTSYYDPMLDYLLFTGQRDPDMMANLRRCLESQEILSTGLENDWGLTASALNMLNKAAYVTGDGRWLWYRERITMDQDLFRLGQSFWPGPTEQATPPTDLVNRWTIHWMPQDMWKARRTGIPQNQSFRWGNFRSGLGPASDYVLIDGYNGAGRNPYHTYDLLELRLNGTTMLKGYHNQVLSSADGMVEPEVAMDGALLHQDVLGGTAVCVAEVPKLAFANWRRSLAQRMGRYAVIVDDLAFRTDSENVKLETTWEMPGASWQPRLQALRTKEYPRGLPAGWLSFPALQAPLTCGPGTAEELLSKLSSIDIVLLKAPAPGAWVQMAFELKQPVAGQVFVDLLNYTDRGTVKLYLDGKAVTDEIDHYAPAVATQRVPLGRRELAAGPHALKLEVMGKRPESARHYAGLIGLKIQPEGAPTAATPVACELHPADVLEVKPGGITEMVWRGPAKNGQHRMFFTLLAENATGREEGVACLRVADNAAAIAAPEAGVASVGKYAGNDGELVMLTEQHLFGHNVTAAGMELPVLKSDVPVDVDWDFETGQLWVRHAGPVKLGLALQSPPLTGPPHEPGPDGLTVYQLSGSADFVMKPATPSTAVWKPLTAQLPALVEQGRKLRSEQLAARAAPAPITAAELKPTMTANLGGKPGEGIVIPGPQGERLAVPVGKAVVLMDASGQIVRRLEVAGEVRALNWWAAPRLLLVGCADELVVAFDEQGNRQWEFTSVMDQEVYNQGKQYWFKSAHPGIHGLYSGAFDDGQQRAFVGSACTLEILDPQGQLVKRLPVFWGPGRKFLLVDAPDGSKNLLIARWHNDGVNMAIVNSRTMTRTGSGYDAVPAGHTYVAGWDCMNREDNFLVDLDGDGKREVVSAINGTWNRITIYSEAGTPLYNAQFGPGVPTARANLRMMDVGDLNGDGRQEIVVGIAAGLVVALDHQAKRLWSRQLPSPPLVVRAVGTAVVAGCEDGTVVMLNGRGEIIRLGRVSGKPVDLRVLQTAQGSVAVMSTEQGMVASFRL